MEFMNNDIDESLRGEDCSDENSRNENTFGKNYKDNYNLVEYIIMAILVFLMPYIGIPSILYSFVFKKNFFKIFLKAFIFVFLLGIISFGLCTFVLFGG